MKLVQTASQTVGPFFHKALIRDDWNILVTDATVGQRIIVEGRILDGDGQPVPDAMVEIWQANAAGRYNHPDDMQEKALDPHFLGFGRCPTDAEGYFRFRTVLPGPVEGRENRPQAPHISLSVFARGLLNRLVTRLYFPDEPLNESDTLLASMPADRRATLVAKLTRHDPEPVFRFDIHLQGEHETVFLDI